MTAEVAAGGAATSGARTDAPVGPTLVVAGWRPPHDWSERLRVVAVAPSRLAGALADAPGGRAHLLAVGSATQQAVGVAASDPGRVRSLVLVEPAGLLDGAAPAADRPWPATLVVPQGALDPGCAAAVAPAVREATRLRAAVARHVADAEAAAAHLVPVEIGDPDPRWPGRFTTEAATLRAALGPRARAVAHVGSTAVPGLAAKPVIDILVGSDDLDACVEPIRNLGYSYWADEGDPEHRFLLRCADGVRTHHVHVVGSGADGWRAPLAFRDALRADPALAGRYAVLKRRLAAAHHDDREAYTAAKADFVRQAIHG